MPEPLATAARAAAWGPLAPAVTKEVIALDVFVIFVVFVDTIGNTGDDISLEVTRIVCLLYMRIGSRRRDRSTHRQGVQFWGRPTVRVDAKL